MKKVHKVRGVTLLESLFVLGLLAIILGVVMTFFFSSNQKEKSNKTEIEITLIIDTINALIDKGNDATPNSLDVINYASFPKAYINDNQIITPFKTVIVIGSIDSGYGITLNNINKPSCIQILSEFNPKLVSSILINNNPLTSISSVVNQCISGNNTLVFVINSTTNQKTDDNSAEEPAPTTPTVPLTDDENDLAKLMQEQMEAAATAKALYASASAQASANQAEAQQAASAGDYDKMNQAYNNMNQALNAVNQAKNDWNQALDKGNAINAAEQKIFANNGQNQTQTQASIAKAAASVGYSDPTVGGLQ